MYAVYLRCMASISYRTKGRFKMKMYHSETCKDECEWNIWVKRKGRHFQAPESAVNLAWWPAKVTSRIGLGCWWAVGATQRGQESGIGVAEPVTRGTCEVTDSSQVTFLEAREALCDFYPHQFLPNEPLVCGAFAIQIFRMRVRERERGKEGEMEINITSGAQVIGFEKAHSCTGPEVLWFKSIVS